MYIKSEDILIADSQSALDLMMTVKYEKDCSRIVLDKKAISEELFKLGSGIAGEVLQKFINYHIKLAIIGKFPNTQASLYMILFMSVTKVMIFYL